MTKAEFIKCMDFMKLGRAVNSENWQLAAMTAARMNRNCKEAQVTEMELPLSRMRQLVAARQKQEALNCLALITAKRVQLLKQLEQVTE